MRWFGITALTLVALVAASNSSGPESASASSCVGAQVHYEQSPKPRLGIRLPWIAAGHQRRKVIGHLFYYGQSLREQSGGRLMIYTGGELPGGGSTKILWVVRPLSSSQVVISGRQLDGPGTVEQQFRSASSVNGTVFPTIVDVPSAGCWLMTVRNGRVAGRFAVVAIDPPAIGQTTACAEAEIEELVKRFVSAFNDGELEALDEIFAHEPDFEWYVTGAPGERLQRGDRASLIPYFRQRHELDEQLTMRSLRFNGNTVGSRTYGNFEYTLTRSARDLMPTAYGGKGAALCYRDQSDQLIVWAMGKAT